jgi:hypothetical protein
LSRASGVGGEPLGSQRRGGATRHRPLPFAQPASIVNLLPLTVVGVLEEPLFRGYPVMLAFRLPNASLTALGLGARCSRPPIFTPDLPKPSPNCR